ncbi:thiamine phosphate synthase [Rhodobacteraceae bacterium RKSG542]|uniref:thiamine phosphate synthase n=1 Tax=Pseudovibrio flavus TaxID=2529854 RepID=UPI0012BCFDA1|nr:thiamine phosphate synthase [Pseudovibrio flavus]MTI17826.1 thiamine phosphate synthase [Pseudovibrio flavus]
MQQFDLSVYLVIGPQDCPGKNPVEIVETAVAHGATVVQLRDKTGSTREQIELGKRLMEVLRPAGVPLIVNDRVDVALAIDAQGVHVGQDDMAASTVRKLIGPDKIIGVSVSNQKEFEAVDPTLVQYLGMGACYPTGSKSDAEYLDLKTFARFAEITPLPTVGIGGINLSNAADVIKAGADGVAVISAICAAEDPQLATIALANLVKANKS